MIRALSLGGVRAAAGDTGPLRWHPQWVAPLHRRVLRAVRDVPGKGTKNHGIINSFDTIPYKLGSLTRPAALVKQTRRRERRSENEQGVDGPA